MSVDETTTGVVDGNGHGAASPGETLRVARQLAGLTQEDIATKLKLSPRQIAAIETGDWSALPERTFTRGFMRNYARLVGIDPDSLGLDHAPSQPLPANQLKPTPEAIGEIVQDENGSGGFSAPRWLVPGLLVAALAAGVIYFKGNQWFGLDLSQLVAASAPPSLKSAVAAKAEAATEKLDAVKAEPATSGAIIAPTLPVSAAAAPTTAATTAPPATTTESASVPAVPASLVPAAPAAANTTTLAPVPAAVTPSTLPLAPVPSAAAAAAVTAPAPVAGEKRITLSFKGKSWTEVRSKGDVIFSETAQPGVREFKGSTPLSFTVGNASNVSVSVDGRAYDFSEMTRNDVARFRIE